LRQELAFQNRVCPGEVRIAAYVALQLAGMPAVALIRDAETFSGRICSTAALCGLESRPEK
jgi:hypothetical protein